MNFEQLIFWQDQKYFESERWWTMVNVILLNRFWYSEWIGTTLPDIFFVSKPSRLYLNEPQYRLKTLDFFKEHDLKKTRVNWVLEKTVLRTTESQSKLCHHFFSLLSEIEIYKQLGLLKIYWPTESGNKYRMSGGTKYCGIKWSH